MVPIDLRTRQNVRRKLLSANLFTVMVFEEEGINVGVDLLIDYQMLYEDHILAKYLKGRHLSNTTTILTANPFSSFNDSHRNGLMLQGIYEINTWNVILTTKIILGQKLQV